MSVKNELSCHCLSTTMAMALAISPSETSADSFPCWSWVVPHLELSELLGLRLVCKGWRDGLEDQIGSNLLSYYFLAPRLVQQRCYLLANTSIDQNWRQACNSYGVISSNTKKSGSDHGDDGFSSRMEKDDEANSEKFVLSNALRCINSQNDKSVQPSTSPLKQMLRIFRISNYIPKEAVVGYSGKFGRQVIGLENDNSIPLPEPSPVYYGDRCERNGTQKCPTCKFKVPRHQQAQESSGANGNDQSLHQYFAITVKGNMFLDLNKCYPKCFTNLPQFISCPICNDHTQQTLVMSDMCYESDRGTENPQTHQMKLTFTPAERPEITVAHGSDEEASSSFMALPSRPSKRARRDRQKRNLAPHLLGQTLRPPSSSSMRTIERPLPHDADAHEADEVKPPSLLVEEEFPPRYQEMMIPGIAKRHTSNAKYGITIFCTQCREFAVIAPAGLCHSESVHHSMEVPTNRTLQLSPPRPAVDPPFVVGGILQRQQCTNDCEFTMPCSYCRRERALVEDGPLSTLCHTCEPWNFHHLDQQEEEQSSQSEDDQW